MRIAFVGTIQEPWGGSEELWSLAAFRGVEEGHVVAASIHRCLPTHAKVLKLQAGGVKVFQRRCGNTGRFDELINRVYRPFHDIFRFKPDVLCLNQTGSYNAALSSERLRILEMLERVACPYV